MYHIYTLIFLFFWYSITPCSLFAFSFPVSHHTSIIVSGTCEGAPTSMEYTTTDDISKLQFLWDFGDLASGSENFSNGIRALHTFTEAGVFKVQLIIKNQESKNDTINKSIEIFAQPALDIQIENACEGSFRLNAENLNISAVTTRGLNDYVEKLNWNIGDQEFRGLVRGSFSQDLSNLKAGNYDVKLEAITRRGCRNEFTKQIKISPLPKVDVNLSQACVGDSTSFVDASRVDGGFVNQVAWNVEGKKLNGSVTKYSFKKAGNYQVSQIVSSEAGCTQTKTHTVQIALPPEPPTEMISDTVCLGEKAELSTNKTFENEMLWFSSPGSTKPINYGTTFLTKSLNQDEDYWVSIQNEMGCNSTRIPVKAYVFSPENIELIASPLEVFLPNATIEFRATTDLPIGKWRWNLEEEVKTNEKAFAHTFKYAGDYQVELELESTFGCKVILEEVVSVRKRSGVSFPVAFSPNGDGANDFLEIVYADLSSFELNIYNAAGHLVFESNSPEEAWDGRNSNNQYVKAGIYICVVKAEGKDGEKISKRQRLTVIR